ncbi:MAG: hypothetical protein ACI9KE_000981 [Polyangiales bacterium]
MFVNRNQLSALVALVGLSSLVGCTQRDLRPLNPCTINGVQIRVPVTNVDKVDLLFMIDNSGSMSQEQASLASEIPNLVTTLASGVSGDRTFPAVRDLRVGVVSSDMGTGGFTIPTCNEPNFGDDGILNRAVMGGGCMAIAGGAPPFLGFRPADGGNAAEFATQVACIADLGTQGCGFEQQLDAVLKALTPQAGTIPSTGAPVAFVNGSRGHGDGANEGFLRDDSLLAIIMLTDEDDCSASNPDLFNRDSAMFTDPDLNLRCSRYADQAVHPISRYVEGLLALRSPDLLVFGAIVGIPEDLAPGTDEPTPWDLLVGDESVRDPRMIERPDPMMPSQLTPACAVVGRGEAYPGLRIARVARALEEAEASAVIQSICQDDYGPALDLIINKIADVLSATCLPRPLNQNAEGAVTCDVVEVLPLDGDITDCSEISGRGRAFREIDEEGRQVCTVCQVAADGSSLDSNPECAGLGTGWFYEADVTDGCPEGREQRISFRNGAEPSTGSVIRLECLQTAGAGDGDVVLGTGCGGADAAICGTVDPALFGGPLVCDVVDSTCQLPCANTSECVTAGLGGYVCYDRDGADGAGQAVCVNPTCTVN